MDDKITIKKDDREDEFMVSYKIKFEGMVGNKEVNVKRWKKTDQIEFLIEEETGVTRRLKCCSFCLKEENLDAFRKIISKVR